MTDLVPFPPVIPSDMTIELRSNTRRITSPLSGVSQTVVTPSARWAFTLRFNNLIGAQRRQIAALLAALQGGAARVYVRDFSYRPSDGVPEDILGDNYDMNAASPTTVWTGNVPAAMDLVYSDGGLIVDFKERRALVIRNEPEFSATQDIIYILRFLGNWDGGSNVDMSVRAGIATSADNQFIETDYIDGPFMFTAPFIDTESTDVHIKASSDNPNSSIHPRRSSFIQHLSASRGALVDLGENLLTYSNDWENAAWGKQEVTVTNNQAVIASDTVGGEVIETTANANHYITQTFTGKRTDGNSELVTASVWVAAIAGSTRRLYLRVYSNSFGGSMHVAVRPDTGVINTEFTGTDWYSVRATMTLADSSDTLSWYRVALSGITEETGSDLVMRLQIFDGSTGTYAGDGSSGFYFYGAQLERSMVAGRYNATEANTKLASAYSNQTNQIILKGLPADTTVFQAGDWIEIVTSPGVDPGTTPQKTELKRVTMPCRSDEYGLGTVQFEPRLRNSPVWDAGDNQGDGQGGANRQANHRIEPVAVLWRPHMRALLDDASVSWSERPNAVGLSDCAFTLVEDIAQ